LLLIIDYYFTTDRVQTHLVTYIVFVLLILLTINRKLTEKSKKKFKKKRQKKRMIAHKIDIYFTKFFSTELGGVGRHGPALVAEHR
jgi:hypothetical protein